MNTSDAAKATIRALLLALACLASSAAMLGCGGGSSDPGTPQTMPTIVSESGSRSARVGEAITLSVTANEAQGYQWQADSGGNWTNVAGAVASRYTLANLTLAMNGARYRVMVHGAGGSVTSSVFVVTVGESLAAPTITTQPADQSVTVGQSAGMSVVVNATSPTFAWQLSIDGGARWVNIGSATSASLALPNVALTDSGKRYRVIVSNDAGVVTSASALLTVTDKVVAPGIAAQPANQSANPGQDVSFSVTAVGTALAYQWQSNTAGGGWVPVAGGTAAMLTLSGVMLADNGKRFRVIVSNSANPVTSNEALLTVTEAPVKPSITTQPQNQTAGEGQNTSMTVVAAGTTPSFQWQMRIGTSGPWTNVSGGNAATLALNNVALTDNDKQFRVIVSNVVDTVISDPPVTLSVTPAPTPPVIDQQPLGLNLIVGQSASIGVTASGKELNYAWEYSKDGNEPWTPIASATSASLALNSVTIADHAKRYRVKVSNTAFTTISEVAVLNVAWGSVTTSDDVSQLDTYYGGGEGGDSPGGGDGIGADGGGGLGKTLNAELTVTRLADGAPVGRAPTHGKAGLVKIKAGPGAAPLLLTLRGNAKAAYYDEGKAELGKPSTLPFGPNHVLHALVDRIDENLGVTPLTEAAYRYAINHFIVDPIKVAAGTEPIRRTATELELRSLTKAQIQEAHKAVLDALNRTLPAAYRLVSLKSLPTPVDADSPTNALKANRYGMAQVVTGGLVASVGQFDPDLEVPAITSVEQFAQDMTDGKLDGLALDGQPMSGKAAAAYDPNHFQIALNVGADLQANRFSKLTIYATANEFVEVAEYHRAKSVLGGKASCEIAYVALRKDGRVSRNVTTEQSAPGELCPADGPINTKKLDWGTTARQLQSDAFIVSSTGTVQGIGSANCGRLGPDAKTDFDTPVPINGLTNITSILAGSANSVARDKAGRVFTFGKDMAGSLGIGSAKPDTTCEDRPSNLTPKPLPELANIVSLFKGGDFTFFAVASDGSLFGWGAGGQGQFAVLDGPLTRSDRPAPSLVTGVKAVRSVVATATSVHALGADGTVWGWGLNSNGEFGDGSTTPKNRPQQVGGLANITQIASNQNNYVYALGGKGEVLRWGNCLAGECKANTPAKPDIVPGLPPIRHLSPGINRVFALAEDGRVFGLYPTAVKPNELTEFFR